MGVLSMSSPNCVDGARFRRMHRASCEKSFSYSDAETWLYPRIFHRYQQSSIQMDANFQHGKKIDG